MSNKLWLESFIESNILGGESDIWLEHLLKVPGKDANWIELALNKLLFS
jgi:hypothetical protein